MIQKLKTIKTLRYLEGIYALYLGAVFLKTHINLFLETGLVVPSVQIAGIIISLYLIFFAFTLFKNLRSTFPFSFFVLLGFFGFQMAITFVFSDSTFSSQLANYIVYFILMFLFILVIKKEQSIYDGFILKDIKDLLGYKLFKDQSVFFKTIILVQAIYWLFLLIFNTGILNIYFLNSKSDMLNKATTAILLLLPTLVVFPILTWFFYNKNVKDYL